MFFYVGVFFLFILLVITNFIMFLSVGLWLGPWGWVVTFFFFWIRVITSNVIYYRSVVVILNNDDDV